MTDPIVERVRQKLLERSQLGIAKYGTTLGGNRVSFRERIEHLQQELMDGANYCEWLLSELDRHVVEIEFEDRLIAFEEEK